MRFDRTSGTSGTGLLVVVLSLVALIALVVVFSQQILLSISKINLYANTVAVFAAVLFPISLLGIIVYQIVRLIGERARRKPGAKLKTRLVLFFALIAILSAVPLSLLSMSFIDSAINFWLRAGIGEALDAGRRVALEYYSGMVANIEDFNRSRHLPEILRNMSRDPTGTWEDLSSLNSTISFVQVFSLEGDEKFFQGDSRGRIRQFQGFESSILQAVRSQSGVLSREERETATILRNVRVHRVLGENHYVVVGIVYERQFDEDAVRLTDSFETFTQLDRYRSMFQRVVFGFYFFFSLPILLIGIFISFLLTDNLVLPIVNLEEATRRVAEGDFSFRILTRTGDELSILANSFNRMIQELEISRKQLVHAEKVSAWQEIAQRLAHEIKNPLTPIKLSAQRLMRKYSENPEEFERILRPSVDAIVEEVDNLSKLLNEFGEFAKLPGPSLERFPLAKLITEVSSMYRNLSGKVNITVDALTPETHIWADYNQMKQVFANLFMNAYQAMADGGQIDVRADLVKKANSSYCRITVRDTGPGIEEEHRNKVFEPYFTTKEYGTGLGLAIVERIIFDHAGDIWFESARGGGTTFYIDLPMPEGM